MLGIVGRFGLEVHVLLLTSEFDMSIVEQANEDCSADDVPDSRPEKEVLGNRRSESDRESEREVRRHKNEYSTKCYF